MTEESPSRIPAPRQTLAMRLAERERQRRLRAERLARLRAAPPGLAEDPALDPAVESAAAPGLAPAAAADEAADREDAAAALEEFLRALTGGAKAPPVQNPVLAPEADPEPAAVLHFQRPPASPAAPGRDLGRDLDRLPGAGPGLVWALERAGLGRLADIAPLAPEELAAKLGPIGRLVPAQAWIDAARAAPPA
jgi:predicted flap endonuclease-1-like 5' DNA nuclease